MTMVLSKPVGVFIASDEGCKDILPDAALCPTDEAIIDGFLRTVVGRAIHPSPALLQHIQNAAQHATIIDTLQATRALG